MIHATAQLAWQRISWDVEFWDTGFYFARTQNYVSKYCAKSCSGYLLYQRLVNVLNQRSK